MQTAIEHNVGSDHVRAIAEAAGDPAWLAQWRHDAWDHFVAASLPDRVGHLWRYSEPERFLIDSVTPVVPVASAPPNEGLPEGVGDQPSAAALVQDAVARTRYLSSEARNAGVIVTDLASAAEEHEELVRRHLGAIVGPEAGKFEALNGALFAGGLFVYVPRNVVLEQPIYLFQRAEADLAALFPRLLVVLGESASATIIDECASPDPGRLIANTVSEGEIGANAQLAYFQIQRWGARVRSHARQCFRLGRDATITSVNIGLGGRYNKSHLANVQAGPNAQAEMIGVIFGSDQQHFDSHTEHLHQASHTYSDMDFKVVLENRARSAYTGLIRIELESQDCEAYQENRNLMLDPTCRAESIPELEILNENVRCTHGATVGPIDEEQVYYLMTRGLPRRDAQRLVVEGFFGPALDRIEQDTLRDRLWSTIEAKLDRRG